MGQDPPDYSSLLKIGDSGALCCKDRSSPHTDAQHHQHLFLGLPQHHPSAGSNLLWGSWTYNFGKDGGKANSWRTTQACSGKRLCLSTAVTAAANEPVWNSLSAWRGSRSLQGGEGKRVMKAAFGEAAHVRISNISFCLQGWCAARWTRLLISKLILTLIPSLKAPLWCIQ